MQPLWKIVWRYFKKLKIVLNLIQSYDHTDPANPLVCINLEKARNLILKDTCTPKFIAALFTTAKSWKQPKCPSTDNWLKKMWYIYVYTMKYYSAIKQNEILPFAATWMNLDNISEISQTEKDKYYITSCIFRILKKQYR